MTTSFRRSHAVHAFTLIEVLITLTIIVVLAALLFSVAGKMLQAAAQSRLASNLGATHVAMMAYTSEHNNTLPGSSGHNTTHGDDSWQSALAPYVNEDSDAWYDSDRIADSVMHDPTDLSVKSDGVERLVRNIAINGLAKVSHPPMGITNRRLATVSSPTQTLALTTGKSAEEGGNEYAAGVMRIRGYYYRTATER